MAPLFAALVVGIGVGSVLAGVWSAGSRGAWHSAAGRRRAGDRAACCCSRSRASSSSPAANGPSATSPRACCCSCWGARRACSTCRWLPTCSTTARRTSAGRSWRPATCSPSAACCWRRLPIGVMRAAGARGLAGERHAPVSPTRPTLRLAEALWTRHESRAATRAEPIDFEALVEEQPDAEQAALGPRSAPRARGPSAAVGAADLSGLRRADDAGADVHRRAHPAGDDPLPGLAASRTRSTAFASTASTTCRRRAPRCSRRTTCRGSTACCWSPCRRGRCGSSSRTTCCRSWWSQGLARIMGAIPLRSGPKAVRSALDTARDALNAGELVCIFPEGGITRSGQLQTFKPGVLQIIKGADAPVVPVYLDELWGSIFSFARREVLLEMARPGRPPQCRSGSASRSQQPATHVTRCATPCRQLGADAVSGRKHAHDGAAATDDPQVPQGDVPLEDRRLAATSRSPAASCSCGRSSCGGCCCARCSQPDEKYVGVLLPPSTGGVVVNAARHARRPRGVQSQLHRVGRRDEQVHRQGRHPARAHQQAGDGQARHEARRRGGAARGLQGQGHQGRQARRRRAGLRDAGDRSSIACSACTA